GGIGFSAALIPIGEPGLFPPGRLRRSEEAGELLFEMRCEGSPSQLPRDFFAGPKAYLVYFSRIGQERSRRNMQIGPDIFRLHLIADPGRVQEIEFSEHKAQFLFGLPARGFFVGLPEPYMPAYGSVPFPGLGVLAQGSLLQQDAA